MRRHSTYQNCKTPTSQYKSAFKYYQQRSPLVKQFMTQSKPINHNKSARQVLSFDRNTQIIESLQQQLRKVVEENQQDKLTVQLVKQQIGTLKVQLEYLKNQNQVLRAQLRGKKHENSKLIKKLKQVKSQKQNSIQKCKNCANLSQDETNFQRERDIYLKQRQLLQNEIKGLHDKVNKFWNSSEIDKLSSEIQTLRNQLYEAYEKITMQERIITKNSQQNNEGKLQRQRTHSKLYELEERIDQLRLQNTVLKSDNKTINSNSLNSVSIKTRNPFFSNSKEKNSFRIFERSISENTQLDKTSNA